MNTVETDLFVSLKEFIERIGEFIGGEDPGPGDIERLRSKYLTEANEKYVLPLDADGNRQNINAYIGTVDPQDPRVQAITKDVFIDLISAEVGRSLDVTKNTAGSNFFGMDLEITVVAKREEDSYARFIERIIKEEKVVWEKGQGLPPELPDYPDGKPLKPQINERILDIRPRSINFEPISQGGSGLVLRRTYWEIIYTRPGSV